MAALPWDRSPGLREQLADFYRDLHEHPELSLQEFRTAERVAAAIGPLGFEVTTGVGGTGVVGVLRNGEGPVVLLRADFDALPVEEKTGLPYASSVRAQDHSGVEVPVMHACGHDMHAACLVGAATLLANSTEEWAGTVVAVFQPAEELACGARNMVADGLFERFPRPDIVLAQHVGPLPAGMIGYRGGPVMSGMDAVQVTLHGRGGHGSRPEAAIDTVLMAANVVTRLQGIVAREVPPADTAVVTVGRLQAGTKDNIIPDTAELGITIRTYDEKVRDLVRAAIERIARAEAAASGAEREPEFDWNLSAPILVNDPAATDTTVAAFTEHFGVQRLLPMPQVNASEDAGVFGASAGVPSVYWFWGGIDFANLDLSEVVEGGGIDKVPANHSPEFAPEIEPTLSTGVEAMVVAARTWLGRTT
ncbi:amidohydrolase [Nocardia macrotermitis]|uniref:Hippurate hydrolase n=1 Tax=Nocardia macrotermitis TaxID=2585198 RepID=A0A7K0D7M8_9NOCA|nr:amidohydrolase [Nocardia macrotermitis]MQY21718.1 Hippurate hydrolase [Nocardia macrotermitis]